MSESSVAPGVSGRLTLDYTPEERAVLAEIDLERVPRHVACIMDGNGRWAKRRLKDRIFGHTQARKTVRTIVEASRDIGIQALTLYTFSSENWKRPAAEVAALMKLLSMTLREEREDLHRNNIRLSLIGERGPLPAEILAEAEASEQLMRHNKGMQLNLAINYGGRQDITRAVQKIAAQVKAGELDPAAITEEMITGSLSTAGIPDPEMLIRTAGEYRISNFLLWEIAYTEIFISPLMWPEFGRLDYLGTIRDFQRRERRFGGL